MTTPAPKTLIEQEADLLETGLALQQEGLRLLLAEMSALATLMPGAGSVAPADPDAEARTEAEVEASFDNMPI